MEGGRKAAITMTLSVKEKIANYIHYYPGARVSEIAENVGLNDRSCYDFLKKLVETGVAVMTKEGRAGVYSAAPGYVPAFSKPAPPSRFSLWEIQQCEQTIQKLKERGLHRRALTELRRLSSMQETARGVEAVSRQSARLS